MKKYPSAEDKARAAMLQRRQWPGVPEGAGFGMNSKVLKRFSPNQPRWPKGSGDKSGEWIDVPGVGVDAAAARRAKIKAKKQEAKHSSKDMLTLLRDSMAHAVENNPEPTPRPSWADNEYQPGVPRGLRFSKKTGTVSWNKHPEASGKVLHIQGEGNSGEFDITGDLRRGFSIQTAVTRDLPASMPEAARKQAIGLIRDPDGSLVKYVEVSDAQDAVREFEELFLAHAKVAKLNTRAPLDRSPKKNWVENAGGLPMYIRRIANHLHAEKGMTISHAIATAVNAVKKMCASGDVNWPGVQQVNAGSRSEACAAVADWERKKVSKVRIAKGLRVMPTDEEIAEILVGIGEASISKREEVEFDLTATITKKDSPRQMVFGWAQIARNADGSDKVDKQGDFIEDVTDLEDAAYDFTLNSRDGGEMHVRKGVSRLVESFMATEEKQRAMGIPAGTVPIGWWVGFKIDDPAVWEKVVKGEYPMFSVHGRGVRKVMDDE